MNRIYIDSITDITISNTNLSIIQINKNNISARFKDLITYFCSVKNILVL